MKQRRGKDFLKMGGELVKFKSSSQVIRDANGEEREWWK
jgi:hypothetical protein